MEQVKWYKEVNWYKEGNKRRKSRHRHRIPTKNFNKGRYYWKKAEEKAIISSITGICKSFARRKKGYRHLKVSRLQSLAIKRKFTRVEGRLHFYEEKTVTYTINLSMFKNSRFPNLYITEFFYISESCYCKLWIIL